MAWRWLVQVSKALAGRFGGIGTMIMYAKFQPSSFKTVCEEIELTDTHPHTWTTHIFCANPIEISIRSGGINFISKLCLLDFEPLIWRLFLPNFSHLTSKLWEEIEVADRQTSIILRGMGYSGGFGIFHCTKNALLLNYYRDVHIYIYI